VSDRDILSIAQNQIADLTADRDKWRNAHRLTVITLRRVIGQRDRYREALGRAEPWMVHQLRGHFGFRDPADESAACHHIATVLQAILDTLLATESEDHDGEAQT
jgi:hypothetical protein